MGILVEACADIVKLNPFYDLDDIGKEKPINPITNNYYEKTIKAVVKPGQQLISQDIKNGDVFSYSFREEFIDLSYSDYDNWKTLLVELINNISPILDKEQLPFKELINFNNFLGTFNTSVSLKLYKDFCSFDRLARSVKEKYFYDCYSNFKYCFKLASNNGLAIFH